MFRKLLKLRPVASSFIHIKIRNGDDTFFWWDPWTPFCLLIHFIGSDGPSILGILLIQTVSDLISSDGWRLPAARYEKQVQLQAFITTIYLTSMSDKPLWLIDDVVQKTFSSRKTWTVIQESKETVSWYSLMRHKAKIPKQDFTVWLFVPNRNTSLDRL